MEETMGRKSGGMGWRGRSQETDGMKEETQYFGCRKLKRNPKMSLYRSDGERLRGKRREREKERQKGAGGTNRSGSVGSTWIGR